MAVATEPQVKDKLYIDGKWVDPAGTETIDVVNASTEEVMGRIPQGTPEDVDRAVTAARRAFETWSQTEMAERAELLRAVAAGIAARSDEIAGTIAQELGMPLGLSKAIQAGLPTMTFTSVPDLLEEVVWEEQVGNSLVVRERVKPVALELGGKSPNVILDDADLEQAVTDGVAKCFLNSGQTCSALTRMLVPRTRLEEAEQIAAAVAEAHTVGDPFEETTRLGPLVSDVQRERVRGYIRKGVEEGARLVTGGDEPPERLDQGYYVKPTGF